jgi:alanine dehydrogenase
MTHEPLILSNDEITEIITVQECMDVVEKLFGNLEGSQMPPKIYLDIPDGDFRAMPAIVGNTAGIKWCGVHLDKTKQKRKINIFAKVLINDVNSGKLLAIMDGEKITAIRTAAVTGIATKYLAKKDASTAAFIGCGNQTQYQIEAVCHARKIKQIRLFDFDYTRCDILKALFSKDYDVVICDDGEECVRGGDIITTLTPSVYGFLKHDWLKSSVHINAIGADAKGKRELHPTVLDNIGLVVYDNWEQCSHSGEIQYVPLEEKKQTWVSLGEMISGQVYIDADQTLFDATGLAIEDVATARYIYEKVK